jgi:predicted Zn-dependent protease
MIVAAMPASWETQIGDAAYKEMREEYVPMNDPVYTNRLFLVAQRLKKGLPEDAPKFQYMVADSEEVNAMALPGGRVIVMRGLIEEATADELAGVLAHEIAHVTEKHGMRQLAQLIGPILIVDYMMNNDGALASLIAVAATFSSLEYSRANETEADEKGFEILLKANIDPRGLTSFFEKLKKIDPRGDSELFSTHPATSARIKRLEELWEQSPRKSGFARVNGGPDPKPAAQ